MNTLNKNTVLVSIVSIIAIFGFLFLVYSATNKPETTNTVYKEAKTITADDHVKWSPDKKHILVEYGDYQCPACKTYFTIIKSQIEASGSGMTDVTKNITFVYRNYPLTNLHKHAMGAAQAAEAAGRQKKYYEMSDKIYESQEKWQGLGSATEFFVNLAKELKLDETKFKADMNSKAVKDKIQKDMVSGNTVTVQGTPTFYLDGKKLENITSFDDFKKILAEAAKK